MQYMLTYRVQLIGVLMFNKGNEISTTDQAQVGSLSQ